MRYKEDRDSSSELLRLIISKMAGHPASFTPLTYAVWYEHSAGINSTLSKTMGAYLNEGKMLDDVTIENYYRKFIAEHSADMQLTLHKDFQKLLHNLAGFTEKTNNQVHQFENNLQKHGDSLNQGLDVSKLGALISKMTSETTLMSDSMKNLQTELENSKEHANKLHRQLELEREEACIDPLTGILNRRGFEAKVAEMFSDKKKVGKEFCLLMVDIDHFKKVNDTYGHLVGDIVIRATASAIKSKIKGQDIVARWGGEEFAVILPETLLQGAHAVAEQIRSYVEKVSIRRVGTNELIKGVTISIGVSEYAPELSMENLVDHADKALYKSKNSGRNRISIYGVI